MSAMVGSPLFCPSLHVPHWRVKHNAAEACLSPWVGRSTNAGMSEPAPKRLFFSVFPSVMLPMFLAALDGTIVSTALPAIAGSLGEVERMSWVVVSYLVAATIAAPVYGRLGDALGRRRVMFMALGLFVTASGLCALAPSILMLTLARVLQGFGGGGLMTLSQALVGEVVPPRERGRYQGYTATVFVSASSFGPVAGGWLTQSLGWQSVFWVSVPLGLIAVALTFRLRARPPTLGHFRFDFIGLILFTFTIAPLLLALEEARKFDFAALPLAALLLGVSALAGFLLLRQQTRAPVPLLPIALLRQEAIWRTNLLASCAGATIVSLVTFLPIYLEVVRGTTPTDTGMRMLPLTAFIAVGAVMTGQIITRTGRSAIIPSIGQPILCLLLLAFAFLAPSMSLAQLPVLFFATSLMCGTAMPVVQTTVQMLAGPRQLGAASASVQFSRSIGSALGTALAGAVLFGALAATDAGTARLFARMVELGPSALAGLSPARMAEVHAEVASAFRAAFVAIALFPVLGAVMAWTMPVRRIDNAPKLGED
jgi:EmrB/QacA subfamily drug resistance transporter